MEILKVSFTICCSLALISVIIVYYGSIEPRNGFIKPYSRIYLYPSDWSLVDLKRFSFVINNDVCRSDQVFLLVLVTSHPGNVHLRLAARQSLPKQVLQKWKIHRVFLLATRNGDEITEYPSFTQQDVESENQEYQDIIQGDFVESYRNLTYKHVMGLQWAVNYCPQAKFLLKIDDDSVIDIFQISEFLDSANSNTSVIIGAVMSGSELEVHREAQNKWKVLKDEFSLDNFPPFVSGWGYATTITTAAKLVAESLTTPYFWIDDVYVTGILAKELRIDFIDIRKRLTNYKEQMKCCLREVYGKIWCQFWIGPSDGDSNLLFDFSVKSLGCRLKHCAKSNSSYLCPIADDPGVLRAKGNVVKSEIVDLGIV